MRHVSLALLVTISLTCTAARAQTPAVGDETTAKVLDDAARKRSFTFYDRMTYKGLTVTLNVPADRAVGVPQDHVRMRLVEPDAIVFHRRPERTFRDTPRHQEQVPLPEEFIGQPGITDLHSHYQSVSIDFNLSKPARVYAYIIWDRTPHPNPQRPQWSIYRLDPDAPWGLYYRDFDAGDHRIELDRDPFCGVGICPLDDLSPKEKIIPVGLVTDDGKPYLNIRSEHAGAQSLDIAWTIRNPADDGVVSEGRQTVTAHGQGATTFNLPAFDQREGVMYFASITLVGAGAAWDVTLPFGSFPPPSEDASSQEPIIPYGGYIKLQTNIDPAIYHRFLAATFYHFRRMHMNAAVLQNWTVEKLDLAQRYGIRAVVRMPQWCVLAVKQNPSLVEHPAILTYMVGDEPKVGEHLDHHLRQYDELTAIMPKRFKPITATIFDSWGTGDDSDPVRIYADHMAGYDLIRFGRLYAFQKLEYGLLRPISYKPRIGLTATFLGLEADAERPWWLAPPFFGVDQPAPIAYWRIPTDTEITAMMHLALAHRCEGIIGWGVHTHDNCYGLCFDGKTMAPTPKNAMKGLASFGAQLVKAKPVLQAFTPARLQVQYVRPYAVDAAGRWLSDGRIAVYVVNRDLEQSWKPDVHIYLGDAQHKKSNAVALYDAIAGAAEVWSGADVPVAKVLREDGRFVYAALDMPSLAPGAAALVVIKGSGPNGAFPLELLDANARKHVDDAAFIAVD